MRLAATVLATLALAGPAAAEDGTGGHLSGSFTAAWNTSAWTGQVSIAMDPGTGPRDAAVQRIRSGQHVRSGHEFSTQGAHVTGLTSVQDSSFDCGDGDGSTSRRTTTFGPVTDADTP